MKKLLSFILLFFFLDSAAAQQRISVDTVYVRCPQERQITKYHFISKEKNSFNTLFSFNVNWELHGYKKESIQFAFNSEAMHMKPGNDWFVKMIDTNSIKQYKNLYTLEQFTKKLSNGDFLIPIANGKVQVIMLYGASCLSKVEVYPVKVSTDLSSEG
jgi:hypothetical protein